MKSLGRAGTAMPQTKPGDHERALALLAAMADVEGTKARLTELLEATLKHDDARTKAEAEIAEAKSAAKTAVGAEGRARSQRDALATETTTTDTRLSAERQELANKSTRLDALETTLAAQASDLEQREAGLRKAFASYHGDDK